MAPARGGEQHIPRPPHATPGGPPPWAALDNGSRAVTVDQIRKAVEAAPPGRPLAPTVPGAQAAAVLLPGRPALVPNPAEVARIFDVSVADLMEPDVYHEERWNIPGMGERPMHFFDVADETVWGATARILHDLLTLVTGSLR